MQGRSLPRAWLPAAAAAVALLAALACSCTYAQEEATAAQMSSQAGCECLSTWYDAAGIERQGCANPDNDPMVSSCAVDLLYD
jgi:hypothetical protein